MSNPPFDKMFIDYDTPVKKSIDWLIGKGKRRIVLLSGISTENGITIWKRRVEAVMAVRTVSFFVHVLMFIRVPGPGPAAGGLTMSLSSVGMIGHMFTEEVENQNGRIIDSLYVLGCNRLEKIRYGIIPSYPLSSLLFLPAASM